MPGLSVWSIRVSLIHLGVGLTFGALLLMQKAIPLHPKIWSLLPAHIDFLLFGWMTQFAMGVAYWILPRSKGRRPSRSLARASLLLLNLGVALSLPIQAGGVDRLAGPLGKILILLAVIGFGVHAWPRVRAAGA